MQEVSPDDDRGTLKVQSSSEVKLEDGEEAQIIAGDAIEKRSRDDGKKISRRYTIKFE